MNLAKRAFLIHGWGGYPEEGWRPWLKKELENRHFKVFVPAMPDSEFPQKTAWVEYLKKIVGKLDSECYFIGHSLGCITILCYLEELSANEKSGGIILVAGFSHDLNYSDYNRELASFFKTPLDWPKIKNHCQQFVAIHSDNDSYVPVEHGRIFRDKLGANLIILHNMKHFSGEDNINHLPEVLNAVIKLSHKENK